MGGCSGCGGGGDGVAEGLEAVHEAAEFRALLLFPGVP